MAGFRKKGLLPFPVHRWLGMTREPISESIGSG